MLEYLLGQHGATDDPTLIAEGLESVRRILARHYVHRNPAEPVKSTIKGRGTHEVIDKLTVELNGKGGFYEVEFTNLGLKKVPIDVDFVKRYPKLLVGGQKKALAMAVKNHLGRRRSTKLAEWLAPVGVAAV